MSRDPDDPYCVPLSPHAYLNVYFVVYTAVTVLNLPQMVRSTSQMCRASCCLRSLEMSASLQTSRPFCFISWFLQTQMTPTQVTYPVASHQISRSSLWSNKTTFFFFYFSRMQSDSPASAETTRALSALTGTEKSAHIPATQTDSYHFFGNFLPMRWKEAACAHTTIKNCIWTLWTWSFSSCF